MKSKLLAGATLVTVCLCAGPAGAQFGTPYQQRPNNRQTTNRRQNRNGNRGNQNQGNNSGVLPLPDGVDSVVSIDAQNTIIAAVEDPDDPGHIEYKAFPINHVYSGAIAKILGGAVVPTESFVGPEPNIQVNGQGNGAFGGINGAYGTGQFGQGTTGFGQGYSPYGTGQITGNPYVGGAFGVTPSFGTPGLAIPGNPGAYPQGFTGRNPNLNFQMRPLSTPATQQLQQVMGLFDAAPRQVTFGP